jgi:fucose 4-O-acetylase-like acetyltransferase
MVRNTDYNISSVFNSAKVLSILSVILAHSKLNDDSFYNNIAERLGCIGVITFLFISGYFYNISKYGIQSFFFKRIKTIIIPWLFLGTVVFVFSRKELTLISWFNWIIGNGTYLYYLTILMLCYICIF